MFIGFDNWKKNRWINDVKSVEKTNIWVNV